LDALRRHLGVDKVDLLGHSWGGYLVMAYTARHREHVGRLIVVDSAAPKWDGEENKDLFRDVFPEIMAKQDGLTFAFTFGDKAAVSQALKLYTSMLFYSTEKRDSAMPIFEKANYTRSITEALNTDLGRFDLTPELLKFDCRTLVITGRFDMNVAPRVAWKIHQAIKGSLFVVFERSGHIPYYEEPVAFLNAVQAFLK
jgi:proline iminopeptidase